MNGCALPLRIIPTCITVVILLLFIAPASTHTITSANETNIDLAIDGPAFLVTDDARSPLSLTDVNGTLFFRKNDVGLWKSDGTPSGTQPVYSPTFDVTTGTEDDAALAIPTEPAPYLEFTHIGNTVFFFDVSYTNDDPPIRSRRLWATDGTEAGTNLLADFTALAYANVTRMVASNDRLYFTMALPSERNSQIWVSDGTPDGTSPIQDYSAAVTLSEVTRSISSGITVVANGTMFFADNACNLWRSDGTPDGTFILIAEQTLPDGRNCPEDLTAVGDTLFFFLDEEVNLSQDIWNQGLWKSDGTIEGTTRITGLASEFVSSVTTVALDLRVFFLIGAEPSELWESDGTSAGTRRIAAFEDKTLARNLMRVGNRLFFTLSNFAGEERELWTSDGTSAGTRLVQVFRADIEGTPTGGTFTDVDGTLIFSTDVKIDRLRTGSHILWKSRGTPETTEVIQTGFRPHMTDIAASGQYIFFATNGELWAMPRSITRTNPGTNSVFLPVMSHP